MRNRLIELIKQAEKQQCLNAVCGDIDSLIDSPRGKEFIADYLLANSVIVLPCKEGQTVYVISESRIAEATVCEMSIYGSDFHIFLNITCDYNCEGCPFSSWRQDYSGEYSCDGEYGSYIVNAKDFGKTIFLTRDEAEQALKGGAEK